MIGIGPTGEKLINSLQFEEGEDQKDVTVIMGKRNKVIIGQTSVIYERYMLNNRNQNSEETMNKYMRELHRLSKKCEFCYCIKQQLICDCLVVGVKDSVQQKLLLQKET